MILTVLQLITLLLAGMLWAAASLAPWPAPARRARRLMSHVIMGALLLLTFMDVPPAVWVGLAGLSLVALAALAERIALRRVMG